MTLTLPADLRLTPLQFAAVCAANPEAVLELDPDGRLITMTPTGGDTSARNGASPPCCYWLCAAALCR